MEKVIVIDGREVVFKSTGALLLRYKAQFQRDALADIMKLEKSIKKVKKENKKIKAARDQEEETEHEIDFEKMDLDVFYRLAWTMAKTADPKIMPLMEWLDTFSEFHMEEIFPEIQELLAKSLMTTRPSKN